MNKTKTFTIAIFISILGLAILGIATYLGHSFISGGEMSNDLLYAVGVVAISAILLSIIIKARKAENDLNKWKIFEYLMLAIYLVFAVIAGYLGGAGHLVEILTHKAELKQMAENDIDDIKARITAYDDNEKQAIESTWEGLNNSISYGARRTHKLEMFFVNNGIHKTEPGITAYTDLLNNDYLRGETFNNIKQNGTNELNSIQQTINVWNLLRLPSQAKRLKMVATEIRSELDSLRENYACKLPKIEDTDDGYDITNYPTADNNYINYINLSGTSFYDAISKNEKIGVIAWIVIAVLNFFILLPYLTTRRTKVLRNKITENDGGIIIKRN